MIPMWSSTLSLWKRSADNFRKTFFGLGGHFQVHKVSEGTCTARYFLGGGPLSGPQGVWRDMHRKIFWGCGTTSRSLRCQKGHVPENILGWGTTLRSLKCQKGQAPETIFGVGDHLQVLEVSEGTCTGKYFRGGGPLPGP